VGKDLVEGRIDEPQELDFDDRRSPKAAIPIATPTRPDSARGVSMTRSAPNFWNKPSVTRNTPPSRPMSSPRRTNLSSRAISWERAWFNAWTIVNFIVRPPGQVPFQLRELFPRTGGMTCR